MGERSSAEPEREERETQRRSAREPARITEMSVPGARGSRRRRPIVERPARRRFRGLRRLGGRNDRLVEMHEYPSDW